MTLFDHVWPTLVEFGATNHSNMENPSRGPARTSKISLGLISRTACCASRILTVLRALDPLNQLPWALQGAWVFCCLLGVFLFVFFLFLFDDGVWWGGVGWDVDVHGSYHADDFTLIMGWGGMVTFMFISRWWCCVDHGVGWDVNVHVHVTLKLFHAWSSFWKVKKQACKAACTVTLGSARKPP